MLYFAKKLTYNSFPSIFFKQKHKQLRQFERTCYQLELYNRLEYYFKINTSFDIPSSAVPVKNFKRTKTHYFFDLKEFLHYISPHVRFAYHFGDETHINPYPTLFKARPIGNQNANSVLFKLNKRRHFRWVNDPYTFSEKKDLMVWRGITHNKLRKDLVKKFWNHPLCNVGQINPSPENASWQKNYMSIKKQLKYKFICCPEGNDVATSLKWAMSSNSLCFMPKPKFETWFMEGVLKPRVHYVEINDTYDDLEEKIAYYSTHLREAEQIINNAHQHVERFKNKRLEDLLCLKVLERYARLSKQPNPMKFE